MIDRYTNPKMKKIWSRKNRFEAFLKVEKAASYAWYQQGLFDEQTYLKIHDASFKLTDIDYYEAETKHDVLAFTLAVSQSLGEEKKYFHYGLTSTDVVDSANGIILKQVNRIIKDDIEKFLEILKKSAYQYKDLKTMGRTHGMHAEITSFGLKFALWYSDLMRIQKRFIAAAKDVEVCKLSGAVGTYALSHPSIESIAAKQLKLHAALISTQTLQRDRYANYLAVIAQIGSEIEKIATEIRHLSRTEVGEVSEAFSEKQKGSSAMPQKRNPISSENVCGLARVLRGYMLAEYESVALWHERDISHSSVERIVLVDATTLIDYMLKRYAYTLENLEVFPNKIAKNIELSHGAYYAQVVLHQLINRGYDRTSAYDIIKTISHRALSDEKDFLLLLSQVPELSLEIDFESIKNYPYLQHVDAIYKKVFSH